MRTTLDLDDALVKTLLERYPGRSKTEAIEEALRQHLETDAVRRLMDLAGTLDVEDLSGTLRAADRHT
ncbi:MAG TPA: type II toxin-antitoxin system VapB family antitoxin [Chloroflexota bacterium]|nr:type II toxin-antitoxin system VapB family antitoxin [Chloroflexota bacterium]